MHCEETAVWAEVEVKVMARRKNVIRTEVDLVDEDGHGRGCGELSSLTPALDLGRLAE